MQKFLNVYSVFILGMGFIVIVLVNSPYMRSLVGKVDASAPYGPGQVVNACGKDQSDIVPGSSWWDGCGKGDIQLTLDPAYDKFACSMNECGSNGCLGINWGRKEDCKLQPPPSDPNWFIKGDCYVQIITCDPDQVEYVDGHMICNSNLAGGKGDTYFEGGYATFDSAAYDAFFTTAVKNSRADKIPNNCLAIQIDVVCENLDLPYADFVVWKGNLFDNFDNEEVCGGKPPEDKCPYPETKANVRRVGGNWEDSMQLYEGDDFEIGSFHDVGGLLEVATDTRLDLTGPDNYSYNCDTNNQGCHGWKLDNAKVGTYTLTVRTYNAEEGFYPESGCNDTATVTVIIIPQDKCPYDSTQARVGKGTSGAWAASITLDEGDKFRIGSFHNDSGNFATDTNLILTDPAGSSVVDCKGSEEGCNGTLVDAMLVGSYLLTVKTYVGDGSTFYPEPECNDFAYAYVEVIPTESDFEVKKIDQKEAGGKPDTYVWGEEVKFNITVTNTGETVLGQVFPIKFVDSYNSGHLEYLEFSKAVRQEKDSSGNWVTVQKGTNAINSAAYIDPKNGDIVVDDLSDHLGNLNVGERYLLVPKFKVIYKGNLTTDNYVLITTGDQKDDDRDKIKIIYNPPPPTDK
ncbi:MAG: hypothetical protein ABIE03_04495 [Patescibacteria group bacterium]|nr:hypothetical protein [Patescibacteria group bacterium]